MQKVIKLKNRDISEWKSWIENELTHPRTASLEVCYTLEAFLELIEHVENEGIFKK